MIRSILKTWPKVLRRSMCMSFFVMPYTFTVVGRFKMVQSNMPLSSIAPHICTFLKRPWTGLCFGHLTKKDIHMLLLRPLGQVFGD